MSEVYLTREQVREVDRRAIEDYGMSGLVLMENAGRGCADVLCELGIDGPVAICCGKGNNAGDGFVIARHLDLRSHQVRVLLWCEPDGLRGDAAANYAILERTEVPIEQLASESTNERVKDLLREADWIVDALLGTGARGAPRPPLDSAIVTLNSLAARKLAVDLPSGLDCNTGASSAATFRADHTCTFVALKEGFRTPAAKHYLGCVHVLDIGVSRKLWTDLSGLT